jgi:hypothetical protein
MPGWDLEAEEATRSLEAIVEAEIRKQLTPGSQAPHAPPALTFGLPGKQKVNQVQDGCDLIRLVSTLRRNPEILPMERSRSSQPTRA